MCVCVCVSEREFKTIKLHTLHTVRTLMMTLLLSWLGEGRLEALLSIGCTSSISAMELCTLYMYMYHTYLYTYIMCR